MYYNFFEVRQFFSYFSTRLILPEFVIKAKKKYYPQTLLEECKYEQDKIKVENPIDDDLEKSLSDESDNDSNDETEFDNDESNK